MKEIAIIGVGIHKFGRFGDKPYAEIGREAARMALKDANIAWRDIQTAYVSEMYLPATSGARILGPLGRTGIPICDVEAGLCQWRGRSASSHSWNTIRGV